MNYFYLFYDHFYCILVFLRLFLALCLHLLIVLLRSLFEPMCPCSKRVVVSFSGILLGFGNVSLREVAVIILVFKRFQRSVLLWKGFQSFFDCLDALLDHEPYTCLMLSIYSILQTACFCELSST